MTEHFIKEVVRTKIYVNFLCEDKDPLVYLYAVHLKDIIYNTIQHTVHTQHMVLSRHHLDTSTGKEHYV